MNQPNPGPFLLRYAGLLVDPPAQETRYDASVQTSLVSVVGQWMNALEASADTPPQTLHTEVRRETTDNS